MMSGINFWEKEIAVSYCWIFVLLLVFFFGLLFKIVRRHEEAGSCCTLLATFLLVGAAAFGGFFLLTSTAESGGAIGGGILSPHFVIELVVLFDLLARQVRGGGPALPVTSLGNGGGDGVETWTVGE